MKASCPFSLLLVLFIATRTVLSDPVTICDDGKFKIEDDILNESGQCNGSHIIITEYFKPAGQSYCQDHIQEGHVKCMKEHIDYTSSPPLSGDYRQLAPKYGEYNYLPPQRWVHALKYGTVVFLYHPCAPLEQIIALKDIATSCMRKHIISSYPGLSRDKPLALVSLGCIYNMSWVDRESVERWIIEHGLKTEEKIVTEDGQYDHGLLHGANIVSTLQDSTLCPDTTLVTIEPPDLGTPPSNKATPSNQGTSSNQATPPSNSTITTTTNNPTEHPATAHVTTPTNCTEGCGHITVVYFASHHVFLVTIFLISLILFVILFSVWLYCWRKSCLLRRGKVPRGKYKPVNQFFPCKNSVIGIAIPETGLPKTLPSEREKLIIESDEDEL